MVDRDPRSIRPANTRKIFAPLDISCALLCGSYLLYNDCCRKMAFTPGDPVEGKRPISVNRRLGAPKRSGRPRVGRPGLAKSSGEEGKLKLTTTVDSHSPSGSGCWQAPAPVSFQPRYWSSDGYPRGGSWRDRRPSYSTRPAYPCPARSHKSCRPEHSFPKPD